MRDVVDSLVSPKDEELYIFSDGGEKCGVVEMNETKVMLIVAATDSHALLTDQHQEFFIFQLELTK